MLSDGACLDVTIFHCPRRSLNAGNCGKKNSVSNAYFQSWILDKFVDRVFWVLHTSRWRVTVSLSVLRLSNEGSAARVHIINRNAFKTRCNLFQNYTAFPHSSASITPQQSLQLRGATRALRQREHSHTRTKAQHRPAATSGDHGAGMPKSRMSSMVAACPSGRDKTISRSLANMKVTRGPLARSRARATSTRLRMLRPSMERRGS